MSDINFNHTWIVLPAHNEARHITQTLQDLLAQGFKNIVVVDDGSTDETPHLVKKFPVFLLKHTLNRGQGAALQTGTDFALLKNAQIIVHFDADGQFLAQEISSAIQPLLSHQTDIVLGSRFLNITQKHSIPWLKRKIILPVSRLINNVVTGIKLTDAHCGFRAMTQATAQKIKITQDGMSHNTQIISQIKKNKLKYQEVPITVIYNEFGQGIDGGFKILKELFINNFVK